MMYHCQLEADNVGTKPLDGIHWKFWWRLIEYCNPAEVPAWRVCSNNDIPGQPAGVDAIGKFHILKDARVYIVLGHPPQRQLQTPVSDVTNVVGAEPNRHPPPFRSSSTPTHLLPLPPFLVLFCPRRPSLFVPVPVPVPVLSFPPYSVPFTLAFGTP